MRLGGQPTNRPPRASAYPTRNRRFGVSNVIFLMMMIMLLKNITKRDYRNEEIGYLRQTGKTDKEIDRYVPKTAKERVAMQKTIRNEYDQLKLDVLMLKEQVKELTATISTMKTAGVNDVINETEDSEELDKKESVGIETEEDGEGEGEERKEEIGKKEEKKAKKKDKEGGEEEQSIANDANEEKE